jgi:hypothetical protein
VIGWCASCQNREAITQALGSPRRLAAPASQQKNAKDEQARIAHAERLWQGRQALLNSVAEIYLETRDIGHLVGCVDLGFNPSCPHPSGTLERPVSLPALIAAVRDVDGRFAGIHRTYLRRDGSAKAEIEPQKASLGPVRCGAVRLVPIEHVLEAGELVIGEGIETSASAGLLLGLPAWAAVSAGNLATGLLLPTSVRRIIIASDHDPAGQEAARAAWQRWRTEGHAVRIAVPNEPRQDFNDLLRQQASGGGMRGAGTPRFTIHNVPPRAPKPIAFVPRVTQLWNACRLLTGTLGTTWLETIGLGHLLDCTELRFHPSCPHPDGVRLPALVAAVRSLDGELIAIHRVYLRTDGSGLADIKTQRAALGSVMGGAIRLAPIENVLAAGEVVIAEDIEEAAALGLLLHKPAWAAAIPQNIAGRDGVVLPSEIRRVMIVAGGSDGAARSAWFRFKREGRQAQIATPPDGAVSYVAFLNNQNAMRAAS